MNLAGPIKVLSTGGFAEQYGALFMTPAETRALFDSLGWKTVAAFQTRNPMHRSHEYLAKIAIEVCDGVLVHSLLGALKPGDIPADVRTRAISVLADRYFVSGTVVQAGYPLDMRYAGPREALLHALFRQNYGCSHQIVGRDHAGVGSYYGPFDAHHIFDQIPKGTLQTRPLKIDVDVLVLQVRRHGVRPHLPARRRRSAAGVRHAAAQVALGGRRRAARIQPARGGRGSARVLRGHRCAEERPSKAGRPFARVTGRRTRIAAQPIREQMVPAARLEPRALLTSASGTATRFCFTNWTKLLTSCEWIRSLG